MKASELKPGQFFECDNVRRLCVCVHQLDGKCRYAVKDWERLFTMDGDTEVNAVDGWDDELKQDAELKQRIAELDRKAVEAIESLIHNAQMKQLDFDRTRLDPELVRATSFYQGYRNACVMAAELLGAKNVWRLVRPREDSTPEAPPVAKPEPEQFKAGDWVVADSGASQSRYGITPKQLVEASKWCLYVEENFPYHPSHFRRATPAEIAKATEPKPTEQFHVGDWLYCIESHAPLVAGNVYKVLAVKRDGWPEVEEDEGYWNPKYFRRATPSEVVKHKIDNGYCLTDDDTAAFRESVNPPTPELTWTVTT